MDRRRFLAAGLGLATVPLWAQFTPATASTRKAVPGHVGALVTRWDTDHWSRGSYSALPVGTRPKAREVIADAVIDGRIVLAGEYASTAYPSTTTGAYLSGRHAARRLLDRAAPRRAIVIGGGMAGAAAAQRLRDAGVDVTVIEARKRIGGRIWSDTTWGAPVELGAAWIHGTGGNPLVPLARAAGLTLVPTDYDDAVARDTVTGRRSAAAERRWDRLGRLTAPLERRCGPLDRSVAEQLRRDGWRDDRIDAWATQVEITQEYALDPDRLGVRAYCEGDDYRGGDVLVAGGYVKIPELLLDGIDVSLSTSVSRVAAEGGGVRVTTSRGDVSADAVVVAVPLALLAAEEPGIAGVPRDVRSALRSLRTGVFEKVVLRYDDQWWGDHRVYGIVGGGAKGAPAGSAAALRWTEFYSLTDVLGFAALAGFAGGSSARARPSSDGACAREAQRALTAAFAG